MSSFKRIKEVFQKEFKSKDDESKAMYRDRLYTLRREPVVVKLKKPTNIPRARELGYKAKQGISVARIRIRRGSGTHKRIRAARRHSRMGVRKLKRKKSIQLLAEERIARKFPNLEVLNSYLIAKDGVDPIHPAIRKDKDLNWICTVTRRVHRNKTSAGKKSKPKTKAKGKKNKKKKKV